MKPFYACIETFESACTSFLQYLQEFYFVMFLVLFICGNFSSLLWLQFMQETFQLVCYLCYFILFDYSSRHM